MSFSRALRFGCELPWTPSTWRRRRKRTPRNGSIKSCNTVSGWCKAVAKSRPPVTPRCECPPPQLACSFPEPEIEVLQQLL